MRLAFALLLVFAFSGCLGQEEAAEAVPENITEIRENITTVHESATVSGENETVRDEVLEISNETQPEEHAEEENISEAIAFGEGRYVLVLDDIVFYGDKSCAAVTIAYSNLTTLHREVVCPPRDFYWTSPEKQSFRIRVAEAAGGYTGTKYARIIIYE